MRHSISVSHPSVLSSQVTSSHIHARRIARALHMSLSQNGIREAAEAEQGGQQRHAKRDWGAKQRGGTCHKQKASSDKHVLERLNNNNTWSDAAEMKFRPWWRQSLRSALLWLFCSLCLLVWVVNMCDSSMSSNAAPRPPPHYSRSNGRLPALWKTAPARCMEPLTNRWTSVPLASAQSHSCFKGHLCLLLIRDSTANRSDAREDSFSDARSTRRCMVLVEGHCWIGDT